jgi:hypothetical protein
LVDGDTTQATRTNDDSRGGVGHARCAYAPFTVHQIALPDDNVASNVG